jgi:hypothetical protein
MPGGATMLTAKRCTKVLLKLYEARKGKVFTVKKIAKKGDDGLKTYRCYKHRETWKGEIRSNECLSCLREDFRKTILSTYTLSMIREMVKSPPEELPRLVQEALLRELEIRNPVPVITWKLG